MEKNEILKKVKDVIYYHSLRPISEKDIELKSNLDFDLNLSSLDKAEILIELEEKFHIMIPDQEAEMFKTVENIVDSIQNKL